jgi:hypothetical protein
MDDRKMACCATESCSLILRMCVYMEEEMIVVQNRNMRLTSAPQPKCIVPYGSQAGNKI